MKSEKKHERIIALVKHRRILAKIVEVGIES